ncbi:unnamed protein product [marine sediment metagenome]|uniref:Uncharacterized protein n=1 Tax=marine sediment metagenome TaxID=412755 RepID=X0ZZV4_9ZZZZ
MKNENQEVVEQDLTESIILDPEFTKWVHAVDEMERKERENTSEALAGPQIQTGVTPEHPLSSIVAQIEQLRSQNPKVRAALLNLNQAVQDDTAAHRASMAQQQTPGRVQPVAPQPAIGTGFPQR